jgi:acetyl-CoA carboxylase biotin carboxyl carrier protein
LAQPETGPDARMPLSDDDIREILRLVDESELQELRIETDGLSLYVRRGDASSLESPPSRQVPQPATTPTHAPTTDGALMITAPLLGTFYRAQAPGAAPFVDLGTHVEPDSVVCLIEVMKMMNSVPAGVSGTVVEVCAENALLVEHGAPLFRVQLD